MEAWLVFWDSFLRLAFSGSFVFRRCLNMKLPSVQTVNECRLFGDQWNRWFD